MKKYLRLTTIILFISLLDLFAQKLGEVQPDKPLEKFPDGAWGVDVMFGEAGFGVGTFVRKQLNNKITAYFDISFSEAKDEREIEYVDYWGNTFVIGKKNRVFQMPMFLGIQYRLFENSIAENLRPYINIGVGPSLIITTPYLEEFFSSFGNAQSQWAVGGYAGLGANFGLDKSSLIGLNVRYYHIKLFGDGVESLYGRFQKNLSGLFITLSLGIMY
ncbi:MAG: hypothetical protein NZM09_04690 [Ignavibacterium sp.]|nr:hypothetical protein [Ignavibacterium sp.]MCX7611913.1 hypothetical protein [Ignavibacterium sp.]MDW8374973.1 hypothetical protein [Ignavibacteriales bacterium]